jgi:alkylation response protein AidB-like acyl-CoA dehydrogenase
MMIHSAARAATPAAESPPPQPRSAPNRYRADLRELRFLLFEQLGLGDVLGKAPFSSWGREEVEMALAEMDRFAREVLGPLNAVGDQVGCRLERGQVVTPPGFKEAWRKIYEAGWKTLAEPEEFGGQDAPFTAQIAIDEFISGSNTAFSLYPGLASGAAEVIMHFGTAEQKARYVGNMYSGVWGGTMCLTEPHAGSDVGSASSTASKLPDGKYKIAGTKIFISGGDHDLAENIIHLVLARVDGAPPGTKGLSLFIVPKRRILPDGSAGEGNDVEVASIEHKMGINGSATCVLKFGENEDCIGELVGEVENVGMSQMFHMMNGARIHVGLQGVAIASSAYLNALDYAKERKQGSHISHWKDATAPRVPIIAHPDVRRMLLDMKARVEGMRALILKLTMHRDRARQLTAENDDRAAYHVGQEDLLVPIVKAYSTDQAFRVCETAIQVFGGAGFIKDHPVEQYCRDAKIFSIYEGTNHIQAMDLVGRKLSQHGGANFRAFLGDISAFVAAHGEHPVLGADVKRLGDAAETLAMIAGMFLNWLGQRRMAMVPLAANRFLEMMAEVAIAWLLLDGARIAIDARAALDPGAEEEHAFYEGKKQAALYFARTVLPGVFSKSKILTAEDTSALDIPDEGF